MPTFHPDVAIARFIPQFSMGPRITRLMRRGRPRQQPAPEDIEIEDVRVPGAPGAPDVSLRLYRPKALTTEAPALFWIHGGGFIQGSPEQDERTNILFARELGITVAALRYRLSPEHPAPAALDDAYAGLGWLFANADARGIDADRIAVGGASAGAGLAAGLTLLAHDRGEFRPAYQLLIYPMLDDRTVLRTDLDTRNVRIWSPGSNRYAWTSYLGQAPGSPNVSPYAAPARREDVGGLPPAWIGVGTLDLFHDEDLAYAERLRASGVPVEVHVIDGVFHGFDALFAKTDVARAFWEEQARALRAALQP
ncbi:alpha/beta hydrolase [Rathayibacter sp. YIM 133350]|uniref:alpha/beta hydrolase n=1 Tax=Rathayibacter sp. YIM 133350 TaxID=3131992 RepID=UPI00307D1A98